VRNAESRPECGAGAIDAVTTGEIGVVAMCGDDRGARAELAATAEPAGTATVLGAPRVAVGAVMEPGVGRRGEAGVGVATGVDVAIGVEPVTGDAGVIGFESVIGDGVEATGSSGSAGDGSGTGGTCTPTIGVPPTPASNPEVGDAVTATDVEPGAVTSTPRAGPAVPVETVAETGRGRVTGTRGSGFDPPIDRVSADAGPAAATSAPAVSVSRVSSRPCLIAPLYRKL